jgi:hypothetical protein
MQVIENVSVLCRSLGENNVVVVRDENTGNELTLINTNGIEVELGVEGRITFKNEAVKQLVSFEPILVEELL